MNIFKFFKKTKVEEVPVRLNVKRCHLLIETNGGDNYIKEVVGCDIGPNPFRLREQHMVYPPIKRAKDILDSNGIFVSPHQDKSNLLWIPFSSVKHITITAEEDYYVDVE